MTSPLLRAGALVAMVGAVLFVVAAALASRVLFGVADLIIGAGLAAVAASPAPGSARSPRLVRGGFGVAAAGAVADGVITLAGVEGIALTACLLAIVGGLAAGAYGLARPRPPRAPAGT